MPLQSVTRFGDRIEANRTDGNASRPDTSILHEDAPKTSAKLALLCRGPWVVAEFARIRGAAVPNSGEFGPEKTVEPGGSRLHAD